MNFSIFQKVINLPLSSAENSIACVLAFHIQRDGNSCFPSYKSISKESGASNKTISKVIRTLRHAGIIDYKHRAKIGTNEKSGGKESNEYSFIFDDVGFYRNKLTKEKTTLIKARLKKARTQANTDMEEESMKRKQKTSVANTSHIDVPNTSQMLRNGKSQNVNNDVCNVAGLRGSTNTSHFTPNTSQMLRRSNRGNVQVENINTYDSTNQPCNEENQKTVWQGKDELSNQESNVSTLKTHFKKKVLHDEYITHFEHKSETAVNPKQQTTEEWLNDYQNSES